MSVFGEAAVRAWTVLVKEPVLRPLSAWEQALEDEGAAASMIKKPCPKKAFIGLCEKGLLEKVPPGDYDENDKYSENKKYAERIVRWLRMKPSLIDNHDQLWHEATVGAGSKAVKQNEQMPVVLALWRAGAIKGSPKS